MQFKDIIGQEEIKSLLRKTVKDNHISHAQLFLGPEGSGNFPLALAYSQYVNCTERTEEDSCGICPSCNKFQKLIHPDLHFVFPIVTTKSTDSKCDDFLDKWRLIILENPYFSVNKWYQLLEVENKQGIIPKNESSEILRKLNLKTYESQYKIMLIWMPETMNKTSANKLLKILEEPPPFTLFIMISSSTDELLPTIISRTQIIKIPQIDDQSITNYLSIHHKLDESRLNHILKLAKGNFIEVLNLLKSGDEDSFNMEMFIKLMRLCYAQDIIQLSDWVDKIAEIGREKQKNFLSYALRMVRENFIHNLKNPDLVFLTDSELDFSNKFSPFINHKNIVSISEELNKAFFHIEMNAYNKIVFMDLSLKLVKLLRA